MKINFFYESITIHSVGKPFPPDVFICINMFYFNPCQLEAYLVQASFTHLKKIVWILTILPDSFSVFCDLIRRNNSSEDPLWKVISFFIFFFSLKSFIIPLLIARSEIVYLCYLIANWYTQLLTNNRDLLLVLILEVGFPFLVKQRCPWLWRKLWGSECKGYNIFIYMCKRTLITSNSGDYNTQCYNPRHFPFISAFRSTHLFGWKNEWCHVD